MDTNLKGLTSQEVSRRVAEGKINITSNLKTKSIGRIFRDNICTLFNAINVVLLAALAFVGSYKNMLFYRHYDCQHNNRYSAGNSFKEKCR